MKRVTFIILISLCCINTHCLAQASKAVGTIVKQGSKIIQKNGAKAARSIKVKNVRTKNYTGKPAQYMAYSSSNSFTKNYENLLEGFDHMLTTNRKGATHFYLKKFEQLSENTTNKLQLKMTAKKDLNVIMRNRGVSSEYACLLNIFSSEAYESFFESTGIDKSIFVMVFCCTLTGRELNSTDVLFSYIQDTIIDVADLRIPKSQLLMLQYRSCRNS